MTGARAGERLAQRSVVDLPPMSSGGPFNVADAAVVVGGILLVLVATREPARGDPVPETDSASQAEG